MTKQEYAESAEEIKKSLYRAAFVYLGDADAATEAVDEAIFRGFCAHGKLREPAYFKTWLTRILINVCLTELRRRRRHTDADVPEAAQAPATDSLPLRDAISRLPKDERSVIILRFFAGMTIAETAKILRLPAGTVSTKQRRALSALRLELESFSGGFL